MIGLEPVHENRELDTTRSRNDGSFGVALRRDSVFKKLSSSIGHLTAKIGLVERRRDERVSAWELNVSYTSERDKERAKIKDISLTGAYLVTTHRWFVGTKLVLTLHSRDRKRGGCPHQVQLLANVVRSDSDGIGVNFVHENLDAGQWLMFASKAASLAAEAGAVRIFQMAKALAFLLRISPSAEDGILKLLRDDFSEERADRALEIVLRADKLLASRGLAREGTIVPRLVLRILEEGSKSNEEAMVEWWAGLLAAFSLQTTDEEENLSFAVLLSKLECVHVLILAAAGQKAAQARIQAGAIAPHDLPCKIDEIKRITRTKNIAVIECALNRLYEFGLLELTIKPFGCASLDYANLKLTKLGLALYHACWGRQETAEALVASKREGVC